MHSNDIFFQDPSSSLKEDHILFQSNSPSLETDIDAYLSQFLIHQISHFSTSLHYPHSCPPQLSLEMAQAKPKKEKDKVEELTDQDLSAQDSNAITDQAKGKKKERPTDHNLCKKFHSIANKCLRKLKIYKYIQPECKRIHKRNYFILVLIVADKTGRYLQFKKLYEEMIEPDLAQCRKALKEAQQNSDQYKYSKQLLDSMLSSIDSIKFYEMGLLYEAVIKLFNVDKMKRQGWIEQAYTQVSLFGEKIQMQIERVLTRF